MVSTQVWEGNEPKAKHGDTGKWSLKDADAVGSRSSGSWALLVSLFLLWYLDSRWLAMKFSALAYFLLIAQDEYMHKRS